MGDPLTQLARDLPQRHDLAPAPLRREFPGRSVRAWTRLVHDQQSPRLTGLPQRLRQLRTPRAQRTHEPRRSTTRLRKPYRRRLGARVKSHKTPNNLIDGPPPMLLVDPVRTRSTCRSAYASVQPAVLREVDHFLSINLERPPSNDGHEV